MRVCEERFVGPGLSVGGNNELVYQDLDTVFNAQE
jgi:hypothetical protein